MDKVRVYIKNPGSAIFEAEIDNTLEAFQAAVGGYIETVTLQLEMNVPGLHLPGTMIVCDEEGLIKGRQYNCEVNGVKLFGTIVFVGFMDEEFVNCPKDFLQHIRYNMED